MNRSDALTRLHHGLAHFAVENAADGIVWLRRDGSHEYANTAICRMLDYDRDDLMRRTVYDVCVGFTPSLWQEHWEALKQAGSMCFEAELWMADGRTLPVEINANFLAHEGREFNCASVRDITERKQAEEALNRSDWLLRIAGQAANIGGWAVDLQSGRILWSDQVCAIHDMPAGTTPTVDEGISYYAPEWREHVRKLFDRCANDGTPFDEEFELNTALGRRIWVRTMGEAVRDASGTITQVQGAFQDITEQKDVKRTLDQSRRYFQELADAMPISVWVADGNGHLFYGNTTLMTYSGLNRADLSGAGWMAAIHPDDRERVSRAWDRSVRTGREYSIEFRVHSQYDEAYRWHLVKAVPVRDDEGTIVRWYGTATDIHARRENEEKITRLALYDPLTGLPNRRLLQDRLHHAMSAAVRHHSGGAVLFLDLDNFKNLNDTLGHDEGDALLGEVARRLLACLREEDTVARFGGDEFVIVINNLEQAADLAAVQAESVGHDILATLNAPYQLGDHWRHITPSIGITLLGDPDDTVNDLLKRADFAMYQAKAAGRNTLRLFDPDMQATVNARIELGTRMRAALERGEFEPYYQAQVNAGGQITGAEALARWNDPEHGVIAPAQFIPVAEDTGLIIDLGAAMLEAACHQLARWARDVDTATLSVSVNISAQQFQHPDFVSRVQTTLRRTGAPPDRLNLEITESLLLHDTEEAIHRMMALKRHGIGFSLDDFGTGYSSLYYLKRLPLDQIKIDQRFVRDVLTDPNDAVIVRTIILLAQSLGLEAIAEGVETEDIHRFLEQTGCQAFQGYLFGDPQPATDFTNALRQALSQPAP
ncbi:sensor domain-containing protein [Aquisalimonas asiatica]|uniref:sensor domain-containing protein n=1 Tax=Aquisalimonas asiatica TaxID=406100 RepID=UPI0011145104|nr:EAL domain-containing protein [Aquisalimonas asiatica]